MNRPARLSHLLCTAIVAAAALPVAGCVIYFGDDDDDCLYPAPEIASVAYRDPQTGLCQDFGGGGCGDERIFDQALPNWAACYVDGCEGLDEATCTASPQCRAAYFESCPECDDLSPPEFMECWGVAPSWQAPPVLDCWSLDAQGCSERTDCSSVYAYGTWGTEPGGADRLAIAPNQFLYCQPETGVACGDNTCAPGETCETRCYGAEGGGSSDQWCESVCVPANPCGPGYHLEQVCDDPCGGLGDCGGVGTCYDVCVPDAPTCDDGTICPEGSHCETTCAPCDPNQPWGEMCGCATTCVPDYPTCAAVLCGPGTHCEETCYPCDPLPDGSGCERPFCEVACVPDYGGPGFCGDLTGPVFCDMTPPACPSGTQPGQDGFCWTGYCIPENECAAPGNPGDCFADALCDIVTPACPEGTAAGVANGCYTGYCIPTWACEGQPFQCELNTTEESCVAAAGDFGCWPSYLGTDCTCDASGQNCTCASVEFAACNSPLNW